MLFGLGRNNIQITWKTTWAAGSPAFVQHRLGLVGAEAGVRRGPGPRQRWGRGGGIGGHVGTPWSRVLSLPRPPGAALYPQGRNLSAGPHHSHLADCMPSPCSPGRGPGS